jgi:hypothetical protein
VHLGAFVHLNASRTISTRTAAQSLVQRPTRGISVTTSSACASLSALSAIGKLTSGLLVIQPEGRPLSPCMSSASASFGSGLTPARIYGYLTSCAALRKVNCALGKRFGIAR